PIGMTVFVEGLLRRHVPQWMKLLATIGTVIGFVANVVRIPLRAAAVPLVAGFVTLIVLLATLAALGLILIRRDRASLSRSANALVRACTVVAVLSIPLAVTDFRMDLGWPVVRLGTLGALLFCSTLLRQPQENVSVSRLLGDLSLLVARA